MNTPSPTPTDSYGGLVIGGTKIERPAAVVGFAYERTRNLAVNAVSAVSAVNAVSAVIHGAYDATLLVLAYVALTLEAAPV
ncbi:hypothetical protein [Halogranum rubrum]|uniref:Uncharacterized protein n=1 Tax=Halogranum salarium B-1 TaxID=1210908 RepID=J3JDY3_9EURY|nr:hypothetical protein [Halogranum salarium]EJN57889.1 hypothetical protein HSB1_33060 [Halogranum salarium B-1]